MLSVWLSLCFSLLAVLTAVLAGSVGQWMQITFFFLVAVVAAVTSGPGDLTSLVFFGLGYSVAVAYRKIHRNAFRVYAPITLLYFGAFVVGNNSGVRGSDFQTLLSFTGAAMLFALAMAIVRYSTQQHGRQRDELGREVERRTAELNSSLQESKELATRNAVLLRELHHRTKNNLQLVSSLLALQRIDESITPENARQRLREAEQRVQLIAMTHELFHQYHAPATVSIRGYLQEVVDVEKQSGVVTDIHLDDAGIGGEKIPIDTAIPLGLIVNELVVNAGQHAYGDRADRPVWVALERDDRLVSLTVRDRGHVEWNEDDSSNGIGIDIVRALAEQISADLHVEHDRGTTWTVSFAIPETVDQP